MYLRNDKQLCPSVRGNSASSAVVQASGNPFNLVMLRKAVVLAQLVGGFMAFWLMLTALRPTLVGPFEKKQFGQLCDLWTCEHHVDFSHSVNYSKMNWMALLIKCLQRRGSTNCNIIIQPRLLTATVCIRLMAFIMSAIGKDVKLLHKCYQQWAPKLHSMEISDNNISWSLKANLSYGVQKTFHTWI